MTPERWSNVKELYHAALERDPDERNVFLAAACLGDDELKSEIESLLAQDSDGNILHTPASELLAESMVPKPLSPGDKLGAYEIVARIGVGGMGEVWKARDPRLDRFVAIKLLRTDELGDENRVRRFTQEARTASSLNHPNIVTIYEISTHDGAPVIVMEFVPGKSLDRLVPRNGMRLGEVLKIGGQIASALAAAAAAGVIHRDVKPGNVMVTDAGHVKVLDFGLAKLVERSPSDEQENASIGVHTREGTILGTASYMSPEQAEGKPVDLRSDIFSVGAVLYEMITGHRAFHGDTTLSTLSSILRDEPKPVSQLAAGTPRDLEMLIARCLRKDPERRLQSMADVRVALLELQEAPDAPAVPAGSRKWPWVGVAATVLASLSAWLWLNQRRVEPLPKETLVSVTTYPGSELMPDFSPDGKQVAFSWNAGKGPYSIYVKLLGENDALRLTTSPTNDAFPTWSPDGKRIAFRRGGSDHAIYTVSPLGGTERKVSDLAAYFQMSWSPDGKWLAIALGGRVHTGISLLPAEGGEPRQISNPHPPARDLAPAFAPDGHRLAYAGCASRLSCGVYIQELDSVYSPKGSPRQITHQGAFITALTWSRNGRSLIYAMSSAGDRTYLWRTEIDGRQPPQRLEIAGAYADSPSASPTASRVVFSRRIVDYDIWGYHVNGGIEPVIVSTAAEISPQFSPDGTRIAFVSDRSGEKEVWVAQADGSKPIQMTNHVGRAQGSPRWSPDSRSIGFSSQGQDGRWKFYVMDAAGSTPRRIVFEPSDENSPSWSLDGKWIYFQSNRTGRFEIWRVPLAGGTQEQVTKAGGHVAYESVDGKTLFYTKEDYGALFERPLSGGEERQLLPRIFFRSFFPVADGIYYIGYLDESLSLEFFRFSDHTSRLLQKIDGYVGEGLSVSPDQKTILFSRSVNNGADLMMIENFQ